jgi:hypothetical protein
MPTARSCIDMQPPSRLTFRDDDGTEATYELESVWTATRVTQSEGPAADLRGLKEALER